jgi:hypothetical protein
MKVTLLRTQEKTSKFGGKFFYFFFKGENGKSYRSCMYPQYGNFKRWQEFVGKKDIVLDNVNVNGAMVDADSFPRIVEEPEPPDTELEATTRRNNQAQEEQINLGL